MAASEGHFINCDETETVGSDMQQLIDSVYVRYATIKRRYLVHALTELKSGVKAVEHTVQLDPSILFLHRIAVAQQENEDITSYFAHEMTAVPYSLFTYF